MATLRVEAVPGYSPNIGRLVSMLNYVRQTVVSAVNGLTQRELDQLHDATSNSIGALLAHGIAVERVYQLLTFEGRDPSPAEERFWSPALDLGDAGRRELRGRTLDSYLDEMAATRQATLTALAQRDDVWLEAPLQNSPNMNPHWAWFHVAEDEINHRGQIRWLRSRLRDGGAS